MKRIIALILTVVLCLSFCSCEKKLKPKDLVDIEWYGVLNHGSSGSSYLKFEKDGTGSYVYYEDNNSVREFTYAINENTILITVENQSVFGSSTKSEVTLEYIEDENGVQLKKVDSNIFYVSKDDYKDATTRQKTKLLSEATELDIETVTHMNTIMYSSNKVKFENEFEGKIFKHSATVYEINNGYCKVGTHDSGEFIHTIDVYLCYDELTKIDIGYNITVVGTISSTGALTNAFLV